MRVQHIKTKYKLHSQSLIKRALRRRRSIRLIKGLTVFAALLIMGISCSSVMLVGRTASFNQLSSTAGADVAASNHTSAVATITKTPSQASAAAPTVHSQASSAGDNVSYPKPAWTKLPLYDDPTNEATQYYESNPDVTGATTFERMGQVPVAQWFGDWDTDIQSSVDAYVSAAAQANTVPVLVLYNIPDRDCGGASGGGAANAASYDQWIQQVASTIGSRTAVTILEPDALLLADCLSPSDQQARFSAMSQAVSILKAEPNTSVYIDAGNPAGEPLNTMAQRLQAANIAGADGFSLNVSYFISTAQNQSYGDQLSKLVGNKHYVIDTSRNGAGGNVTGFTCNPSFAAFGSAPTVNTGDSLNDAWLWIKIPWESDAPCNGAPDAGDVYWSYALQLAANAGW
jgi:endoglucanase